MRQFLVLLALCLGIECQAATVPVQDPFTQGSLAYAAGDYEHAAALFRQSAAASPAPGTLQNLGNAEWRCGHSGPAILAWEQARWLDPLSPNPPANLRFARKARLLDAPDLVWYEICSTWLPVNAWPWLACLSFWLAAAMVMLPGIFSWRKAGWHQALAAACFAIFLLTLPAMLGVHTRSKIGVLLPRETQLCLTPTAKGQTIARLAAGETARLERQRGPYLFIRTATAAGWIARAQFSLIARNQ